MKVMLVCNAGVSTSIVVKKMQDYAAKEGVDLKVQAIPAADAVGMTNGWDVILLGPQIKFYLNKYKEIVEGKIPVDVIATRDYGMANGEAVYKQAKKLYDESKK